MLVNPKPNDLLLVVLLMQFLNNWQLFIHKINAWVYIDYSM